MRHLYQQIFVTIVGVAVGCVALAALALALFDPRDHMPPIVYETARYLADDLPAEPRALRRELRRRAHRAHVVMALWTPEGRLLARTGPELPRPDPARTEAHWFKSRQHVGVVLPLESGRQLVVAHRHPRRHAGFFAILLAFTILLCFVLLGSYWAARRITRRLEALGDGVQRLGTGDRQVRVEDQGHDEVAGLARQFNAASERIATLLEQQERVLAGASHELRSPLARLRMALELLADDGEGAALPAARRVELLTECERDIVELDMLVDDILLGARLRDRGAEQRFAPVDLSEVVASECARAGVEAHVVACSVEGDARALRSLVRNLLDNAARYGKPPVVVRLSVWGQRIRLSVEDAGTPIVEADRERIFEPFVRPHGHAEGQGGAGLGLALVRDIARHHDGDVHYEVSDAGGSRFCVELRSRRG